MDNNDFTIEVSKNKNNIVITFEKGCIVDYEYLWNKILIDNLLSIKNTKVLYGVTEDYVKFTEKISITFKTPANRLKQ